MPSPSLAKYKDRLPVPQSATPAHSHLRGVPHYVLRAEPLVVQVHSDLPKKTSVWGFSGSFPGPTLEALKEHPIVVDWVNALPPEHVLHPTVDGRPIPPLDVRIITHFHGGHTPPESDGHPLEAFPPGHLRRDRYPLHQRAATYWYHDHAMGLTRFNVHAGLAGFFLVRDPAEDALKLPSGEFDVPLVLQDRVFDAEGQLVFSTRGDAPEFFGDVPLINGQVWPYLPVKPRKYRFRLLNGSNARFYDLALSNGQRFHVVGSDGGLLASPIDVAHLLIAPGERYDVVIDFAAAKGTSVVLTNAAAAPYPSQDPDTPTIPELLRFDVDAATVSDPSALPASLAVLPAVDFGATDVPSREFVLDEVTDTMPDGSQMKRVVINGKGFMDPITEAPVLGTTEDWNFYNHTGDAHPMHLHLVQFRVVGRVVKPDGTPPEQLPSPPADGRPLPLEDHPAGYEAGWKDTVVVPPNSLTRIRVHFDGYSGRYVWHCHILEHEENDMMRPLAVLPPQFGHPVPHGGMGGGATARPEHHMTSPPPRRRSGIR